jgi:hypothetical protein
MDTNEYKHDIAAPKEETAYSDGDQQDCDSFINRQNHIGVKSDPDIKSINQHDFDKEFGKETFDTDNCVIKSENDTQKTILQLDDAQLLPNAHTTAEAKHDVDFNTGMDPTYIRSNTGPSLHLPVCEQLPLQTQSVVIIPAALTSPGTENNSPVMEADLQQPVVSGIEDADPVSISPDPEPGCSTTEKLNPSSEGKYICESFVISFLPLDQTLVKVHYNPSAMRPSVCLSKWW